MIDWVEKLLVDWGREHVRHKHVPMASISGIAMENHRAETRTGLEPSRYRCNECSTIHRRYVKKCTECNSQNMHAMPYQVTATGKQTRSTGVKPVYYPEHVDKIDLLLESAEVELRNLATITYIKTLPRQAINREMGYSEATRKNRIDRLHYYLEWSLKEYRYLVAV